MRTVPFLPLDPALYRELVRRALAEDLGWGDVTTEGTVEGFLRARGVIRAKSPCVLAGLDVAAEAFRQLDPSVTIVRQLDDGQRCAPGDAVAHVRGQAAAMLTAARTALNFVQRMSGIATLTSQYVQAAGGRITILDTRNTTPTLRALEKYAVRCAGGSNHRTALDDGILIEDNHVRLAGGVGEAVRRMKAARQEMPIEVETRSLEQVDEALQAGADVLVLDSLTTDAIREAVRRVGTRAETAISGGVTLDRIPELAGTGATYVCIGALTHSAPAADFGLELEPDA